VPLKPVSRALQETHIGFENGNDALKKKNKKTNKIYALSH
jgi:hypothetical protein